MMAQKELEKIIGRLTVEDVIDDYSLQANQSRVFMICNYYSMYHLLYSLDYSS